MEKQFDSIAVLIDADNTCLKKLESVINEIATYGRIVVRRAYGSWSKGYAKTWEPELLRLAIKPEQQIDYTVHKNASDMALVIGAMELLATRSYDAFVIVSSDSDFTPLVIKLRESCAYVIGVGEKKTVASFKSACDDFILLENLDNVPGESEVGQVGTASKLQEAAAPSATPEVDKANGGSGAYQAPVRAEVPESLHNLFRRAYEVYASDSKEGWAPLAEAATYVKRARPDFSPKTYGYAKFSKLLGAFPSRYEVKLKSGSTKGYFRYLG